MVLKPEAVRARLLKLEEVISRLGDLQSADLANDFRDAWAVERGLQLAAELVFDIGNHILSAHFGISAQDYEDILEQLSMRLKRNSARRPTTSQRWRPPSEPGSTLYRNRLTPSPVLQASRSGESMNLPARSHYPPSQGANH